MKVSANTPQLNIRIGNRSHPVQPEFTAQAQFFDADENGVVTLAEIQKGAGPAPAGMTFDWDAYSKEIRQQMVGQPSPHRDAYPTPQEIDGKLEDLAALHKDKAEVVTIGMSSDGYPVKALHVSNNIHAPETSSKPSVIITGNIHAREWVTNAAVTDGAEKLLNGAAPEALENLEIWFVPDVNPDGLAHSLETDNMWRKNTKRDANGEIVGVDLNRNFPHQYRLPGDAPISTDDDKGASDDPTQPDYRGTGALSEVEAQNVKDLIDSEGDAVGLLDVHGFGRMVMVSKGENSVTAQDYEDIGTAINDAINVDYKVVTEGEIYPTTGGLSNYADSLGMVGVTLEIGTSYQPEPKKAKSIADRASDGIVEFISQMDHYTR